MSPSRKKPCCHSCGSPMAGHKRPNGSPVCPAKIASSRASTSRPSPFVSPASPLTSSNTSPAPLRRDEHFIIPTDGVYHRVNPNWIPPPPAPLSALDRNETPASWISTEPADDIPVKREPTFTTSPDTQITPLFEGSTTPRQSPSLSSIASSTSTLSRSLTDALLNCVPLVTIFGTPKEEISKVTREARRKGLYTAIVHQDRTQEVKDETSLSPARQNSWMVLMGGDPDCVSDWCEKHDNDKIREVERRKSKERKVGTLTKFRWPGSALDFIYLVLASCVGSVMMYLFLSLS